MSTFPIRRLFEHMWWADTLVAEALDHAPRVAARAVEIYAHVLGAELIWLDRIERVEQSEAVWPQVDLAECRRLARQARKRYEAFLEVLRAADLTDSVRYTNSVGQEFTTALQDILLHVALHGAYHRGQVAMLLRDAGADPRPTDYIGFVRGVPAATREAAG